MQKDIRCLSEIREKFEDKKTLNEMFKSVITDEFVEGIAFQSNLYSVQQTGQSIYVDKHEIEKYLGGLLYFKLLKWRSKIGMVVCDVPL